MRIVGFCAFLGALLILTACSKPEAPEFVKMENLKMEATFPSLDIMLGFAGDALLKNPNPFGLEVVNMDLDVFVEGQMVSNVKQELAAQMPASADFKLPLHFEVPIGKVFKKFKPTMAELAGTRKIKVKVVGNLTAKKGMQVKVPIKYEKDYDIPTRVIMNYFLNNR